MVDQAFFKFLGIIESKFSFFMDQTRIIAMICFAMALGVGCVKVLLEASEMKKEVTKLFLATIMYFVLIWGYPRIMNFFNTLVMDLAYSGVGTTVSGGAVTYRERGTGDTQKGFVDWIKDKLPWNNKRADGKNGSKPNPPPVPPHTEDNRVAQITSGKITNASSGMLSPELMFTSAMMGWRALFESLNVEGMWDVFQKIPSIMVVFIVSIIYIVSWCISIVCYCVARIEYSFFYVASVLFIPMLLWDGTKFMFEKVVGGAVNIFIKLFVVQMVMYVLHSMNINMLETLYLLRDSENAELNQYISTYGYVAILSILGLMTAQSSDKIAGFLSGGQPSLGFGDVAKAALGGAAAGGIAAGAAGGALKMAGGLAGGAAQLAGKAVMGGIAGGSGGGGVKGALKGAGKSLVSGAASAVDKGMDNMGKLPGAAGSALGKTANSLAKVADSGGQLDRSTAHLGQQGGGGKGGGAGGGSKGKFNMMSGKQADDQAKIQRLRTSQDSGDRDKAAQMQGQYNRMYHPEKYGGLGGRFKNMGDTMRSRMENEQGFVKGVNYSKEVLEKNQDGDMVKNKYLLGGDNQSIGGKEMRHQEWEKRNNEKHGMSYEGIYNKNKMGAGDHAPEPAAPPESAGSPAGSPEPAASSETAGPSESAAPSEPSAPPEPAAPAGGGNT